MMSGSVSGATQGGQPEGAKEESQWGAQLQEQSPQGGGDNGWRVAEINISGGSEGKGGGAGGGANGGEKPNGSLSDEDIQKIGQKIVGNFSIQMMKETKPVQLKGGSDE